MSINKLDAIQGFIQWKGTDVCIDIHCSCGGSSHFDGDFMYYIECPHCGKVWKANTEIEFTAVSKKEAEENKNVVQIPDKWL